jgi:small-conductance mechanosensitive channel
MESIWTTIQGTAPALLFQFVRGIVTVLFFWLLAGIVRRLLDAAFRFATSAQRRVGGIATSAAHTAILLVGVITALGTMGFDVSAMVASLGLTGFALGFALRDLVSNAVAGLMLIYDRTFEPGDRLWVTGQEGDVVTVNLRYTVLRGEDRRILVPNSVLLTNAVVVICTRPRTAQPASELGVIGGKRNSTPLSPR